MAADRDGRQANARERLVYHVQELERLEELKRQAGDDLKAGLDEAKAEGFDTTTLKVVLKLRRMTPDQRRERRALESIYMAALGMLEGEALPESARRRLDPPKEERPTPSPKDGKDGKVPPAPPNDQASQAPPAAQSPRIEKDPVDARKEGAEAAAAGRRIYDNPYQAGDPCRAAWDEGWCASKKSHGMDTPAAFQRRTEKPPAKPDDRKDDGGASDDAKKGAA